LQNALSDVLLDDFRIYAREGRYCHQTPRHQEKSGNFGQKHLGVLVTQHELSGILNCSFAWVIDPMLFAAAEPPDRHERLNR
jgi:hypothetical protein